MQVCITRCKKSFDCMDKVLLNSWQAFDDWLSKSVSTRFSKNYFQEQHSSDDGISLRRKQWQRMPASRTLHRF